MQNRKFKICIDIFMAIVLVSLMAYELVGSKYHEYAGILMFVVFVVHNLLNIKWYKSMFKGKYTPYRTLLTFVNISIFALMLATMISGIVMSKYVFNNIHISTHIARNVHLSCAYWGYVLMSVHIGLHISPLMKNKVVKIVVAIIAIYGIFAFVKNNIISYMLLINQFVDRSDNIIIFIIEYVAIMFLFAFVGYIIKKRVAKI